MDNISSLIFLTLISIGANLLGLALVANSGLNVITLFFCLAFQGVGVALGFIVYEIAQDIAKDFKKWTNA